MECLEKNLRLFNAFLKNSRRKEKDEELVRSIRDVVYEVEDVVDAFITCAFEKNSKAGSCVSFLKFWEPFIDLHAIAMNVEELKLNVDDDDDSSEVRPPRQKDEDLILRLTKRTDYLDVVSPIGVFGVGKTALTWKILNDPTIRYDFPIRIMFGVQVIGTNFVMLCQTTRMAKF